MVFVDGGVEHGEIAEHEPRGFDEGFTSRREGDLAAESVEEGSSQLRLDARDRVGERGLGDVNRLRGSGEAELVGYGDDEFEVSRVQLCTPSRCALGAKRFQ